MTEKREFRNFIDGEFTSATSGAGMDVINPSTGEVYATAPLSGPEDVDAACRAAQRAFEGGWRDTTPGERMTYMLKLADAIESNAEELVADRVGEHRQAAWADHERGDPADGRPDPVLRRRRPDAGGPVER